MRRGGELRLIGNLAEYATGYDPHSAGAASSINEALFSWVFEGLAKIRSGMKFHNPYAPSWRS